jgi:co-chaperonin GroES (HSP10)
MQIKPLKNIVYIQLEENTAGALDTSSKESAVEFGEVLSIGTGIKDIKVGDKLFVKSWGIDNVTYQNKRYCFVNTDTGAILAKVEEEKAPEVELNPL